MGVKVRRLHAERKNNLKTQKVGKNRAAAHPMQPCDSFASLIFCIQLGDDVHVTVHEVIFSH